MYLSLFITKQFRKYCVVYIDQFSARKNVLKPTFVKKCNDYKWYRLQFYLVETKFFIHPIFFLFSISVPTIEPHTFFVTLRVVLTLWRTVQYFFNAPFVCQVSSKLNIVDRPILPVSVKVRVNGCYANLLSLLSDHVPIGIALRFHEPCQTLRNSFSFPTSGTNDHLGLLSFRIRLAVELHEFRITRYQVRRTMRYVDGECVSS